MQQPTARPSLLASWWSANDRRTLAFDLFGIAVFAAGLVASLNNLHKGLGVYDEAIVLLNASLMNHGAAPYRDFYTNYPPGVFLVMGALFRLFGEEAMVGRWAGLALHLIIALLAGRLGGLLQGRRLSWMPAGLVALWLSKIDLTPFAYLCGVAWALGTAVLFQRARRTQVRGAWLLCGACAGVGTFFRHDLFAYAAALLLGLALGWWALVHRKRLEPETTRAAGLALAGAAAALLFCWGPVFARAGLSQPIHDLFLDQVQYVLPARVLPMPSLGRVAPLAPPLAFGLSLPVALHEVFESSVLILFLGPVAAGAALYFAPRLNLDRPLLCMLGALAVAVLPQMLGRTDLYHAIYGIAPALILLWGVAEALSARLTSPGAVAPLAVAALLLCLAPRNSIRWAVKLDPGAPVMRNARGAGTVGLGHDRDAVVAEIQALTHENEPIFVGLTSHKRTLANELDLYFLSGRPGSTRYLQFDPNVVSRQDVQEEMIAELEAAHTRVAVLSSYFTGANEPNASSIVGSDLLDRYLASNFHLVRQIGWYYFLVRNGADAAAPARTP